MRVVKTKDGLRIHAVAGTYVVMLGFDLPEADCAGLLGFSIHRTDHSENESAYLVGMKAFAATDPGFPAGGVYSTRDHPIQSFQWADYSAKPGHRYSYRIMVRKGSPEALVTDREATIEIVTESPQSGDHDVYFNRGVAASQEYARRFGERAPDKVGDPDDYLGNPAYAWLSRGLYEALVDLLDSADPARDAFRIAAYEFAFTPFLSVIRRAVDRGVDIRIVYDGREDAKGRPGTTNRAAVAAAGLTAVCTERTRPKAAISHNKFIVRLRDGTPLSVWTGGTNFSAGGIFGHSNVAHLVEEPAIASQFLAYWKLLDTDPTAAALKTAVEALTPLPTAKPPTGTTAIFSPRNGESALANYATYANAAQDGLMMTFAFGMNDIFKAVYRNSPAPFRLALLEKATRPMEPGPARDAELQAIQQLRNMPQNVFAVGNLIKTNAVEGWVKERLSGLNRNVQYVHNKFMLIDPLGADPLVIAGSANFSKASTVTNDENMIIVRGNKRVADIYLGEFMRLWSHHAFRESLQWRRPDDPPKSLSIGDWWADSFGNTERAARRKFFARA